MNLLSQPVKSIVAIVLSQTPSEIKKNLEKGVDVPVTFLVDMADYFKLNKESQEEANRTWKEAIKQGHDIQPLFSSPLNESIVKKSKETLELLLQPNYRVTCCRIKDIESHPHEEIYRLLTSNGIHCDTSINPAKVPYPFSTHQPYFANPFDFQLLAPPAERILIELPISQHPTKELSTPKRKLPKIMQKIRARFTKYYCYYSRIRACINFIIPEKYLQFVCDYKPEEGLGHQYFVVNDIPQKRDSSATYITLSEMASIARKELLESIRENNPNKEAEYQVQGAYFAVMGEERNAKQSYYLQDLIPKNCKSVLDFGCGSGYWTDRIAKIYPAITKAVGIDFGEDFINKANENYQNSRVSFVQGNFENLPFENASFDCVYADATLEHTFDTTHALKEIYRVLSNSGALIALIPSDAKNPRRINPCHTWKTFPKETSMRLKACGFENIEIKEVNIYKTFSMAPYPPSNSLMMYVSAYKPPNKGSINE